MAVTTLTPPARRARSQFLTQLGQFCRQQPTGAVSLAIILVMMFAGVFAERVAPYDPVAIDFGAMLAAPDWQHWAGTDAFGRDIMSRMIYGARTALIIGLVSATIGCTAGAVIGATSAYFGGIIDTAVQRVMDLLMSFPIIVLALVIVAVLGRVPVFGIDLNLIAAISIPMIPAVSRVIRSAALSVRAMPYIDAARIILRHMAPNLTAPYLIMFTAYIAQAILLEAALSFLGLGVTEPTPAWGLMLSGNASDFFRQAPWMIIAPGAAISLAVFSFSLFGDALRDWLDPRFKT
jgi:peptide/nickel transport system permease protein